LVSLYIHQGLLLLIAAVLAASCLLGAVLLIRHAPAASLALVGAVIAGTIGFFLTSADGPRGVPMGVVSWATLGTLGGAVVGLVATRGRPPSGLMWRSAFACVLIAPFAAALLVLAIQRACPLYVHGRAVGYCTYGDQDLLGGWSAGVVILLMFDLFVVIGLLLVSGWQAKRREGIRLGDDEWARL
jgi:hypothetical protein